MSDTEDLKAQLKALEEQLERKRLEEEIAQLQRQLAAKAVTTTNAANPSQSNIQDNVPVVPVVHSDNEYEEDEYTEEYEEEEVEEEVVVEIVEESKPCPTGQSMPSSPPTAAKTTSAGRSSGHATQQSTRPDTSAMYEELHYLEEVLKQKQLQEELRTLEQQAASLGVDSAATSSQSVPIAAHSRTASVAKPSAPFKQRVIPNIEASAPGQETPMELLLGPKLYKNGKLIASTTKAACEGQQLMLLFFAASWNRLCKPFFPKLLDFYKLVNQPHCVECIYISTDRNLNEFKEAFAKMPYLAMPTGTAEYKNRIANELKILEVPFLVVLDVATAHVITTNGVDLIDRLERGNWDQASALVDDWKRTSPVPMDKVQLDTRLVNGVMERGIIYWHN